MNQAYETQEWLNHKLLNFAGPLASVLSWSSARWTGISRLAAWCTSCDEAGAWTTVHSAMIYQKQCYRSCSQQSENNKGRGRRNETSWFTWAASRGRKNTPKGITT
eukprot:s393_g25.t2